MRYAALITAEQQYTLLEMRAEGKGYVEIGKEFGLTNVQASNQYRTIQLYFSRGYLERVKDIAKAAGKSFQDIVTLIKKKFTPHIPKEKTQLRIQINQIIFSPGIWYAKKTGQTFDAERKQGYYIVNKNPLFKVKEIDCTEIKTA